MYINQLLEIYKVDYSIVKTLLSFLVLFNLR